MMRRLAPKEPSRRTNKKPLPKARVGTSWSAALLSGPSLGLAAPSPSVVLLWNFTNTSFVPIAESS